MISRSAGQFVDRSARPATPSRLTGSAREFLDAEPEGRTALALVDVKMEGMTGFDLQEELAARHSAIPIITSFDDAATRERIRRTRWECLVKPFEEQALLGGVGRVRKPV
jgi:FixJ family two-component response regulator